MVAPSATINVTLYDKLNFVFLRDIAPVASVVRQTQIVVANPSFTAKTIPELIAYAKANPGKITMASAGIGSVGHLVGEVFKMMAGVDMRSRSVSRRRAGIDRSYRRTGHDLLRRTRRIDRVRQERQAARVGGYGRKSLGSIARCSDGR